MEVEPAQPPRPGACLDALDHLAPETRHLPDSVNAHALALDLDLAWRRVPRRRFVFYCDSAQGADLLLYELLQCNKRLFDSLSVERRVDEVDHVLSLQGTTLIGWMPATEWHTLLWRDCTGHSMTVLAQEIAVAVKAEPYRRHLYGFWNSELAALQRLDMQLETQSPDLWQRAEHEWGIGCVTTPGDAPPWEFLYATPRPSERQQRPYYYLLVPALPKPELPKPEPAKIIALPSKLDTKYTGGSRRECRARKVRMNNRK